MNLAVFFLQVLFFVLNVVGAFALVQVDSHSLSIGATTAALVVEELSEHSQLTEFWFSAHDDSIKILSQSGQDENSLDFINIPIGVEHHLKTQFEPILNEFVCLIASDRQVVVIDEDRMKAVSLLFTGMKCGGIPLKTTYIADVLLSGNGLRAVQPAVLVFLRYGATTMEDLSIALDNLQSVVDLSSSSVIMLSSNGIIPTSTDLTTLSSSDSLLVKEIFMLQPAPLSSPSGNIVVSSWRRQTSILDFASCSSKKDSLGRPYLLDHAAGGGGGGGGDVSCLGFDFDKFAADGSDVPELVAYVYNSAVSWALRRGLIADPSCVQLIDTSGVKILHWMPSSSKSSLPTSQLWHEWGSWSESTGLTKQQSDVPVPLIIGSSEAMFLVHRHTDSPLLDVDITSSSSGHRVLTADTTTATATTAAMTTTAAPAVINIGGLFNPFDHNGNPDKFGTENMAAFLMAIREINDKNDGLWDDVLPDTQLRFAVTSAHGFVQSVDAIKYMYTTFSGSGVTALVGALPSPETIATNLMGADTKTVQVSSYAQKTTLGDGNQFPYKATVVAIQSFMGMVLQEIACNHFNIRKITVFSSSDELGSNMAMESTDNTYCYLEVLSRHLFRFDTEDFTEIIGEAKKAGAKHFIIMSGVVNTAALIAQGYEQGLFDSNSQIIVSGLSTTPELIRLLPPGTDVEKVMRGVVGISYQPSHNYRNSEEGRDFIRRWRRQPSTAGDGAVCHSGTDDEGAFQLYRSQTSSTLCNGLNFSSYDVHGDSLSDYAGLTYDATVLLARGLDVLVGAGIPVTGDALMNAFFFNNSFTGVTGLIETFIGMPQFASYGRGGREVGNHYYLMNFNAEMYRANIENSFVPVGVWSVEDSVVECPEDAGCFKAIYNNDIDTSVPPPETPPVIVFQVESDVEGPLLALASLAAIPVLGFTAFVILYRNKKLIKASQPIMLYFLLAGEVLAVMRVFVAAAPFSDVTCALLNWSGHLAFALVFGSLYWKTWRLDKLINNKTLRRVKITANDVFVRMSISMGVFVAYLIVLQFVGGIRMGSQDTSISNQTSRELFCSFHYSQFQTALIAAEAFVLILGARLCWRVKDAPDSVNESGFISLAMTSIVLVCLLELPLEYVIQTSALTKHVTASAAFAICAIITTCVLFVPKAFSILAPPAPVVDMSMPSAKKPIMEVVHKILSGKDHAAAGMNNAEENNFLPTLEMYKKLPVDGKIAMCNEQITIWRQRLMKANEGDSSQSSSSSHHVRKPDGQPMVVFDPVAEHPEGQGVERGWTATKSVKGGSGDAVEIFTPED